MADRPQDREWEYGRGNGHDRTEEEKRQFGRGEEGRGERGEERRGSEGPGRWYREAKERFRDAKERRTLKTEDDHLLGMGYASPPERGRGRFGSERDDRGRWRDDDRPWQPRRDFRESRPESRGGGRFEGGEWRREGMGDYGYPSETQGRGVYERYSERDFPGRDAQYAGRSGLSYVPGSEQTRGWHPPEEDWEREHLHYRDRAEEGRAARVWEREPSEAQDIMTKNPRSVLPDSTLREVARIMHDEDTGIVPVSDANRRLVGLLTDRDMVVRTFDEERSWADIRVREVMTDDVHAVTADESVHDIIELMGKKQIRRVPVVDRNDRLIGMVSMADIANRADRDEELQHALDRISRRRTFWSRLWS